MPDAEGDVVSDIVTRLRRWTHAGEASTACDLMDEAAEEIERLRLELFMRPTPNILVQANSDRRRLDATRHSQP